MFCFPNAFGRRERLQGAAECSAVPTERTGTRWRKRKEMQPLVGPAEEVSPTESDDPDHSKVECTSTLSESDSEGHEDERAEAPTTLPVRNSEGCDEKRVAETPTLTESDNIACKDNNVAETLTLPVRDSKECEEKRAASHLLLPVSECEGRDEKRAVASLNVPASDGKVKPPLSPNLSSGSRFKLLREGDIQVCYLNRARTVVSKILSSKFLRRWETHRLYLNDESIASKTPNGVFDVSVPYSSMEEVYVVTRWDASHKFCIRIVIADGSLLLQASSSYIRDQWFHSILWKRNNTNTTKYEKMYILFLNGLVINVLIHPYEDMEFLYKQKNIFKYRNILQPSSRPEVVLKELKSLVCYATTNPLHDECVIGVPIQIVSDLLAPKEAAHRCRSVSGEMITAMTALLENTTPSPEMCRLFSDHCVSYPRSAVVSDTLTPIVQRTLIHNVDFGKYPNMRQFIQDYIKALYQQNDGEEVVRKFVTSIHGSGSVCPHLRVLPNLVSATLAAVSSVFEDAACQTQSEDQQTEANKTLQCFMAVTLYTSEYDDWRPELAQLLQPVPFPPKALTNKLFLIGIVPVMKNIIADPKCDIQDMVLGIREGKQSWLHVFCPSQNKVVVDDGFVWCLMVERLLACCSRRKYFVSLLVPQLGACFLLALRGHCAAQEALCLMLEWDLVEQEDQKMQIVTTLQSTLSGLERYSDLCQRQMHLKELQQKGGPRKLTLPSRSTDDDIARLLSCGSFGNLACLSLAFTHVTSSCASELIKLPALRYLNLWATQFGDPGLLMISEHLHKLQVLNLCETPVTDTGIAALSSMTNLRKLNLNSTKLTAHTFECLKKQLPELEEFDVRYTEAW